MKVLMAIGEKNLSLILRSNLENAGFEVVKEEVFHREYLNESVDFERPDLIILHDRWLPSQFEDPAENEEELIQIIENWRRVYDSNLRVCVMCERDRRDPFLSKLVARNVLDIFNERQIPTALLVKQLQEPPIYMNVSRYGVAEANLDSLMNDTEQTETENSDSHQQPNSEKPKVNFFSKQSLPKLPKTPQIKAPRFQIHVHKQLEEQKQIALQERRIILVVSPFDRAGSTFVAHQLAYNVAQQGMKVHYFENPFKHPYTFDRLAGHVHAPNYYSSYSEIPLEDENEYIREWSKDGVGIQAMNPAKEKRIEEDQFPISRFLRHMLAVHDAAYLIVDIGSDASKAIYDELVEVASHVLVVVDNDIPRLELFEQYTLSEQFSWIHNVLRTKKAHLVANRYVKGIEASLPTDSYFPIPSFLDEWVFESQLAGTFDFKQREARKKQSDAFAELAELILDGASSNKRKSGVQKMKNWIPKIVVTRET